MTPMTPSQTYRMPTKTTAVDVSGCFPAARALTTVSRARFTRVTDVNVADSTGRRNTLITEVCDGTRS